MIVNIFKKLILFEKIIVSYCLLMVVFIIMWGRPLLDYYESIGFFLLMITITIVLAHFINGDEKSIKHFIRHTYPVVMFIFFYKMTGNHMFLIFDSFFDNQLTAFELTVFGSNPTIYIDQHWLNDFVNEILSFCYFAYYFMIPLFVIYVYRKKDYEYLRSFLSAICLTFFASYLLFFLYPVEGPRWFFEGQYINDVNGYIFRPIVELVITNGAVRGGCMPSSHFAVALVCLIFAFKKYRKLGYWLIPLVSGLGLATFWGRYHYVSDVIIGGIIGLGTSYFILKIDNSGKNSLYDHQE